MSLQPLDAEVFARIKADHRNRRGPFAHTVVAIHELVGWYNSAIFGGRQAKWALREVCAREALCKGNATIRLFVAHAGPLVEAEVPAVLAEYRRERGLPDARRAEPVLRALIAAGYGPAP